MEKESKQGRRLRTVSLIIVITLAGKVLGLVRDMLLGHNFATGMEGAAFQVASRIPRTFFDAIFASAISASFIPVFAECMEKRGREEAFRLSHSFFTWAGLLTGLFSLLGMAFAGPIVSLLADGFDPKTAALCAALLRILFPTVFFTGVAFSMVGVLQSMGEFYIPAALSVASNGIIILYYLLFCRNYGIMGLAWAFLLGWAAQVLVQMPWLRRRHFCYRPSLWHPGLKNVGVLMLPVMVSTWAQPLCLLISTRFATHLFEGAGASAMDYANTLYTMIAGILVLSVTNVIFPEMSRLSTAGRREKMGGLILESLRGMLFLLIPMTAGLMLLAKPLVRLLYEWKNWDSFSTDITARALVFMSLGMAGYGIQNVLARAFYAEQDGRTPMIAGAAAVAVNVAACLLLTGTMDVAGLGLATAAATWTAAAVLLACAIRKYPEALGRKLWLGLCRMLPAVAAMAAVVWAASILLPRDWENSLCGRILDLGIPALLGIAIYLILAVLLRLPEMDPVRRMLRRK